MQVRNNKFVADIQTGQIKLGIYLITVLFSLYYSFQSGKDDLMHSLITAVIILGIGGYYTIGKKKDGTFYTAKEAFAVLWAALYFILPIRKVPAPDNIEYFLKRVLDAFRSSERTPLIYAVVFFVILNIFGNKFKNSLAYFIGIYISQYLIVSEIFRITFRIDTHFIFFITVFALLNDFARYVVYREKSNFKMLLLLYLILYVLIILYPDEGFITRIQDLFYLEEVWPRISSILLISGAICILENYNSLKDLSSGEMTGEFVEGCALIALAVYIFVGKGWPQYFHLLIVYAALPVIVLLKEYVRNHIADSRAVLLYWVCVLFCLPALGRTLNENRRYYLVLLGLFIIRHILLKVSWKGGKEIIMQDYWGIAAAILLFTARHNVFDMNIIQNLFHPLLVLIGSCVLWVRLTHDTYTFNKQLIEGKYSKKDYEKTLKIQKAVLILVMAMVLFTLLT